ncbi:MAG: inositol monophosphatase family protein [Thermodesulfobacteriota bacterium]|nr:inositol monophosphatase family protein [Thermodesulfobacteriota bacterium]
MWKKERSVAAQAAQEAGKILNRIFGQVNHINKKGEIDLVTEADLQSEKMILDIISHNFPQDSIVTEESGEFNHLPDRKWIIDPLDGTTNFAHTFPFFAVSIALEIEQEIILGVVFNPYTGEYFEAVKGMGALLNESPIKISRTRELGDSLLATGFPYDIRHRPDRIIRLFKKMIILAQGVRRPGSAAIDLCYVAAGRFDGFWEEGLKPWDTAAGSVIVKEAGGKVSDFRGDPYSPYQKNIVAANPFIHERMIAMLYEFA